MNSTHKNPPMLLLLDKKEFFDFQLVKDWFEHSRYLTCEAEDVFEALEECSDFTVQCRPDVILLKVGSLSKDYPAIKGFVHESADGAVDMPIFALSNKPKTADGGYTVGTMKQLKAKLNRMIPKHVPAGSRVAVA